MRTKMNVNITTEQLLNMSFPMAKKIIKNLPPERKEVIQKEVDKVLVSLYQSTKQYYDSMFGSPMNPKTYIKVMNKIKHYEILQNWLFGYVD